MAIIYHIFFKKKEMEHYDIFISYKRKSLPTANNLYYRLTPNGNFYLCPAFFYEEKSVGDIYSGLCIKNPQLLKIDNAPICSHCDAYHCKRCVWLNKKTTLEINTPSHEQCVVSHIERNESRELLIGLKKSGFKTYAKIKKIGYLDPFERYLD